MIVAMVNRTKEKGFSGVSVKDLGTYRLNAPIIWESNWDLTCLAMCISVRLVIHLDFCVAFPCHVPRRRPSHASPSHWHISPCLAMFFPYLDRTTNMLYGKVATLTLTYHSARLSLCRGRTANPWPCCTVSLPPSPCRVARVPLYNGRTTIRQAVQPTFDTNLDVRLQNRPYGANPQHHEGLIANP